MDKDKDYEYYQKKLVNHTYVSGSFDDTSSDDTKKLRYISKVIDEEELHEFMNIKDEIVLRKTPKERQEIKAVFYEDTRENKYLTIQRFSKTTGSPIKKTHFTFSGDSLNKFMVLLRSINYINLDQEEKIRLDDEILNDLLISEEEKKKFFIENPDLVKEIVEQNITKYDVISLAYRKEQLAKFENLLKDNAYFDEIRKEWGKRGPEDVWQHFFENNPWIFGYGLNYIYLTKLDDQKLEQVVSGHSIIQGGKRVDALMKTRGWISSLCFVEIKTHETQLMHSNPYRVDCWRVSESLGGSVSQIQKTVQKAIKDIQNKLETKTPQGEPTGEIAFLNQPKSFVVIGSLKEFMSGHGVNEEKFGSFELFRRNLTSPEIITFDELFERAKFIVQYSEGEEIQPVGGETDFQDNEIPF